MDLSKKLKAREKAIEELPAMLEAKKVMDAAVTELKDFQTNNAEYVATKTAADTTADASRKAWDTATAKDVQYPVLCEQLKETLEKQRRAKANPRDATRGVQVMTKNETAAMEKEIADLRKKIKEREQLLGELPEVSESRKAAAAAEAAFQEFTRNNAEYNKLLAARQEAIPAYRKALELAKTNDEEYNTLKQGVEAARTQLRETEKNPKKPK
ncbi:MAG: hypothetical protein H7831_18270 [Magnetococcus sp. WYHC-3]